MERIFCDGCGREIFLSDLDMMQINLTITGRENERNYRGVTLDFHKNCGEKFINDLQATRNRFMRTPHDPFPTAIFP